MGRLIGSLSILTGCLVLLIRWTESAKQRERMMRECVRFMQGWEYAVCTKQMRLSDFLATYPYTQSTLRMFAGNVRAELLLHTCPSGQIVWQNTLQKHKDALRVPEEAYEILIRAGDSFFGSSRREATECITQCIRQMERCIEEERMSYRGKRKVYMPVGMLTGVMLVILLL